jgi:hypothetical protein
MRTLIAVLLLSGCGGGFVDKNPRCSNDVFDWFGGLVKHLDQGEDFKFNYNPALGNVDKIVGGYVTENTNTDFYWYTTYSDGFYLAKSTTQGIGTAYANGDVDVLLVEDIEDSLNDSWRSIVREERGGCSGRVTSYITSDQGDFDWPSIQSDINNGTSVLEYSIVSGTRVEYTRTYEPNNSEKRVRVGFWNAAMEDQYSETWEYGEEEGTNEMLIRADGTSTVEFWWSYPSNTGTMERIGVTEGFFSGATHSEFTQGPVDKKPDWDIVSDREYDGSGTAVWSHKGGTVCDLEFESNGDCSYACDDGTKGDC